MKYLKSFSAICLLSGVFAVIACGDEDDPYNSSRPIGNFEDNSNSGYAPHPGPSSGGGGGGGENPNNTGGPDDSPDGTTALKDLDQQQINTICTETYEHYKNHDTPALPEGRGACLDFAVRRAAETSFDPESRFMVCEDELLNCLSLTNQAPPTTSCVNPRAQVNCEATVEEFVDCVSQDAKILTSYFLQIHNHTCADYTTDFNLTELDALLDNYPQPQQCHTLLTKCPQIFD